MTWDLKIVNARLQDGDGAPARPGELAVAGGRIVALDRCLSAPARRVFDAAGGVVTPGFIDLHTHCQPAVNGNYLRMGVTLVVGGNCGFSPPDIAAAAGACAGGCGPNIAFLYGHNTARLAVMGNVARGPAARELEAMRRLFGRALADGACGLSTGLAYVPGNYAGTAELIELARLAADAGGYYASHLRNEGEELFEAVREAAVIGRAAGLPVHLSHLKIWGRGHWGRAAELLALIDGLEGAGLDITQDQYPYTASCGRILLLFPPAAQEGGPAEMTARLADPGRRAALEQALCRRWTDYYGGDGRRVVISHAPDPALAGCSIAALAARAGRPGDPAGLAATVLDIVGRFPGQTDVYCIFHGLADNDLETIMRHRRTAVASDGWVPQRPEEVPHPRSFGTFPRVLGHYAREKKVLTFAEAVRRMTALPAARLGLADRGRLAAGAWADLVVLDPETVGDRATFAAPRRAPRGIRRVLVNGRVAVADGRLRGVRAGRFISGRVDRR